MKFSEFRANYQNWLSCIYGRAYPYWQDILLAVALAAVAGFTSYQGAQLINPVIVDAQSNDVWFEADVPRVFANMTDRNSDNYRTKVHPLFTLITFPIVFVIKRALNLNQITAVHIVIATVAFLWLGTLFIVLRLIGCNRFDAALFSILAATSAAAMFWFTVPETYSFGSLTFLLALGVVALAQYQKLSPLWYTIASALTLSFTVTNWMAGLLATIATHPRKRCLWISVQAFCVVSVLWGIQRLIFPSSKFPFASREEKNYILMPEAGGPLQVLKSFLCHTMVMPAIDVVSDRYKPPHWSIMTTQASIPGSGSLWGTIAVVLWTALLGLGLWGLFSVKQHPKLRLVLGLTLLGQLLLHTLYGSETFLYALHLAPLLVVLAAFSLLTRARPLALVLAAMLVLTAGVNNSLQFKKATDFVQKQAPPRYQVLGQMQQRPAEPWPRGDGHVVLAVPGSLEADKAYHEPGGSFSPAVGSFGVSVWLADAQGNLQTTSDAIPLSQISQQLIWADGQNLPGILTKTNNYQSLWSSPKPGHWMLNLKTQANTATKPMVVIRSVGPAGGAIQSLNWNGQRLQINDRWFVTMNPPPLAVHLGEEGKKGWMSERSTITQWKGENGWGYARFELAAGSDCNVVIENTSFEPVLGLNVAKTQSALELDLPDQQFAASLDAQVAHLLMSLVGQETRPGEPTNYPLSWQRDGAYIVVALARAGQLDVAKQLSTYLAENDFFGGFGSEADAPGLSIWALQEVAVGLNKPEYNQWLWPHMRRKAEFILKMLATDQPIRQPVKGSVVPSMKNDPDLTLVAEPSRNGLIIGRMDNHRPLLFVNAVSYRGLLDAASLADRVNQPADAKRWRAKAADLKQAWEKAFKPPESENDRTYISSLWPTWVADAHKDALLQSLQKRWTKLRDAQGEFHKTPLWTYFDIAEAHQWLFLDQPDRVWTTLRWFWAHQASPGLYTWWEGKGEENTFNVWQGVRGWVKPPHVTPHYWTAAEMLLLQLDMLAYTDRAATEPTVVIGAGIPKDWLNQPMKVRNLPLLKGQLNWYWDGQRMRVKILGEKVNVRLAPVFPPNTPLNIEA
ncbi:MAG: hypothetical protein M3O33_07755 [Cyanobacteriota bacterium]|nr:hypothetical protein [Cyanobacteriota bacterium]